MHGGVTRVPTTSAHGVHFEACALCGKPVMARTAFTIQAFNGDQLHACCSHCGLLLLSNQPADAQAFTVDFLLGQTVGVRQATFLVKSSVTLCCAPSVLSFASQEDAQHFQQGFGGQAMDAVHAQLHLHKAMALDPEHHAMDGDHRQ